MNLFLYCICYSTGIMYIFAEYCQELRIW